MLVRIGLLALLAAGAAFAGEPPRFGGRTMDGERFSSETLRGKIALIQFWTARCGECLGDQAPVDRVTREFADRGLVVLAVNLHESREEVKAYLEKSPRVCKIVLSEDTDLARVFSVHDHPFYVLLDRRGNAAYLERGPIGLARLRKILGDVGLR